VPALLHTDDAVAVLFVFRVKFTVDDTVVEIAEGTKEAANLVEDGLFALAFSAGALPDGLPLPEAVTL